MVKRGVLLFAVLFALSLYWALVCPMAGSADFPRKPIKLIVTADIGGGEDSEARAIAPFLEKYLGVGIVIENQGGAGGKIAFERFQKTEPDGYTLITYTFPKSVII
jgi:tripartite-type tricarboxylate transporter receptor subunit TctC